MSETWMMRAARLAIAAAVLFGAGGGAFAYEITWTNLAPTNTPGAREQHGMALFQSRVILFGGRDANANLHTNDLWEWDGANRQWKILNVGSPRPSSRLAFGMAAINGGSTFIVDRGVSVADIWTFTGQWQPHPASLLRYSHAIAWNGSELIAFGGKVGSSYVAATEAWSTSTSSWEARTSLPEPKARSFSAAAYLEAKGRMVMFGGEDNIEQFRDTWEHVGKTWEEVKIDPINSPPARSSHRMAEAGTHLVVLFGGRLPMPAETPLNDAWIYDGRAWSPAESRGDTPSPRLSFAMTSTGVPCEVMIHGGKQASLQVFDDTYLGRVTPCPDRLLAGDGGPNADRKLGFSARRESPFGCGCSNVETAPNSVALSLFSWLALKRRRRPTSDRSCCPRILRRSSLFAADELRESRGVATHES